MTAPDLIVIPGRAALSSRRRIVLSVGIGVGALLLVLAVATIRLRSTGSAIDDLVKASTAIDYRTFEGRLTGGFPHRRPSVSTAELEFIGNVMDTMSRIGSRDRHPVGVGYLLLGRHTEAIRALTSALCGGRQDCDDVGSLIADSGRAEVLSDLAAAFLARYEAQPERMSDLRLALNAAERSWQLRHSPEAAWNRALALEKMRLEDTSATVWREYLKVDPASPWADEARSRSAVPSKRRLALWDDARNKLVDGKSSDAEIAAVVGAFPVRSRQFVEDELLLRWSGQVKTGDLTAARGTMRIAQRIGNELATRSRERAVADALELSSSPSFARDYESFASARAAYLAGDDQKAISLFSAFPNDAPPFSIAARIYEAGMQFTSRNFRKALMLVNLARKDIGQRAYPTLLAQTWWIEGLVKTSRGDHAGAVVAYRTAHDLFDQAGDHGYAAFISILMAENQRFAGDAEGAWRTILGTLRDAPVLDSAERQYVLMSEAGKTLELTGDGYASIAVYERAKRFATAHALDTGLADVAVARAQVAQRLGLFKDAIDDVDRAARAVERVGHEPTKARVALDLAVTRGMIFAQSRPQFAIENLTTAIDAYRQQEDATKLAKALVLLARAEDAVGQPAQAEATLDNALSEFERQRDMMPNPAARQLLMRDARPIADELVRRQWNSGRNVQALTVTERLRGLRPVRNSDVSALVTNLPASSTHVVYYALPEKTLVWIVDQGRIHTVECAISVRRLGRYVAELNAGINARSDEACTRVLADLYAAIFEPLRRFLGTEIVLIPDGPLVRVPFAALLDRRTGRFVAQDAYTRVAASLTSPRNERSVGATRLLVVAPSGGGPALNIAAEVAAARRAFGRAGIQIERTLTPEQFVAEAPRASHLHFAGHAVSAERETGYGHLVLGDTPDATLTAGEIAAVRLPSTDLVVLAACGSGATNSTAEGSLTLSHAFLAAGARSVVGTLWAVDDDAASAFSRSLYGHLGAGKNIREAMHAAQLELLAKPQFRSVSHWAAFQLWGEGE